MPGTDAYIENGGNAHFIAFRSRQISCGYGLWGCTVLRLGVMGFAVMGLLSYLILRLDKLL